MLNDNDLGFMHADLFTHNCDIKYVRFCLNNTNYPSSFGGVNQPEIEKKKYFSKLEINLSDRVLNNLKHQ